MKYDCVQCGACCYNIDQNRAVGYRDYVEVEKRDAIRKQKKLLKIYVYENADGIPHMKLDARRQRCTALEGTLGRKVGCEIYEFRPGGCRRLKAGSAECRRDRRERGIDPPLPPRKPRAKPAVKATVKATTKPAVQRRAKTAVKAVVKRTAKAVAKAAVKRGAKTAVKRATS
ncbi:MAG: YkgJ family cysteine cluster protein [Deltaproteobacteria bacterium]